MSLSRTLARRWKSSTSHAFPADAASSALDHEPQRQSGARDCKGRQTQEQANQKQEQRTYQACKPFPCRHRATAIGVVNWPTRSPTPQRQIIPSYASVTSLRRWSARAPRGQTHVKNPFSKIPNFSFAAKIRPEIRDLATPPRSWRVSLTLKMACALFNQINLSTARGGGRDAFA